MRGAHTPDQHAAECALLRDWASAQGTPTWTEFLERWKSG